MKHLFILLFLFLSYFSQSQTLQDSLFAHYLLDGNALDATGNGNNGVVSGATLTSDRFGTPNSAYSFDGYNDIIRASNFNNGIQPATDYITATCWFKVNTAKTSALFTYSTTCSSLSHDYLEIALTYINGFSDIYGKFFNHNPLILIDDALVTDGQWHFLVYTYDMGITKFYLDGQFISTVTVTHPPLNFIYNPNIDFTIGGAHVNNCTHNNHFDGIIDDVRLYVRALNDQEVFQLYYESFPDFTFNSNNCDNTIQFTNTSINATSYSWDFGDGTTSTSASPSHAYTSSGNYIVTLKSFNNGYFFTYSDTIAVVSNQPIANFSLPSNALTGDVISITDNSTSSSPILFWDWDFGNGTTSNMTNPTVVFNQFGTYNVTLIVTNALGCSDTLSQNVTAYSPTMAIIAFTHSAANDFCDLEVYFSNQSINMNTYLWDFGDGTTSSLESPVHLYTSAGDYTVTLIASNDTTQKTLIQVVELEEVYADFISPTTHFVGVPLELIDNSSNNVVQWDWSFGNGETSQLQHPTTSYSEARTYDISLIVNSLNDCKDTISKVINIVETPIPIVNVPNAFTPDGDNINDAFKLLSTNTYYEISTFRVFNRWGNLVYNSTNSNGWNGYYKGQLMPQDTYIYYIKIRFPNGEIQQLKGNVLLIR